MGRADEGLPRARPAMSLPFRPVAEEQQRDESHEHDEARKESKPSPDYSHSIASFSHSGENQIRSRCRLFLPSPPVLCVLA